MSGGRKSITVRVAINSSEGAATSACSGRTAAIMLRCAMADNENRALSDPVLAGLNEASAIELGAIEIILGAASVQHHK
jgi:hypothetical protein